MAYAVTSMTMSAMGGMQGKRPMKKKMMRLFPLNLMCSKRGESVNETQDADVRRRASPLAKRRIIQVVIVKLEFETVLPERRTVQCQNDQTGKNRKPREEVAERMYKAARESKNVVAVTIH